MQLVQEGLHFFHDFLVVGHQDCKQADYYVTSGPTMLEQQLPSLQKSMDRLPDRSLLPDAKEASESKQKANRTVAQTPRYLVQGNSVLYRPTAQFLA